MYNLNNKVNSTFRKIGRSRKEEVVFNRIRLGHSNLNGTLKIIGDNWFMSWSVITLNNKGMQKDLRKAGIHTLNINNINEHVKWMKL